MDRQTSDLLVELVRERCVLFHDAERRPYASFENDGHRECWLLKSLGFAKWLSYQFYRSERRTPAEAAIRSAISMLSGHAKFAGEKRPIAIRVATQGDSIFIDLCNDRWQALEVTRAGSRIVDAPAVRFIRLPAMRALPDPQPGGDLSLLCEIVNIPEADRLSYLTWMLECFRPNTPYPVLELVGEQGSAKSSTQHYTRELIDPNQSNNRAAPKNVEDLFVAAGNGHMVSFQHCTLEAHLAKLAQLRDEAQAKGDYSAAISAEYKRGQALGFYIERKEQGTPGQFSARSREEADKQLEEVIAKLAAKQTIQKAQQRI